MIIILANGCNLCLKLSSQSLIFITLTPETAFVCNCRNFGGHVGKLFGKPHLKWYEEKDQEATAHFKQPANNMPPPNPNIAMD